jgi:hypothetical protein
MALDVVRPTGSRLTGDTLTRALVGAVLRRFITDHAALRDEHESLKEETAAIKREVAELREVHAVRTVAHAAAHRLELRERYPDLVPELAPKGGRL